MRSERHWGRVEEFEALTRHIRDAVRTPPDGCPGVLHALA